MSALGGGVQAPNMNKAHAGAAAGVLAEAVTTILNRVLALRYPNFWNEDMGTALATIISGLVTWGAVYLTPSV